MLTCPRPPFSQPTNASEKLTSLSVILARIIKLPAIMKKGIARSERLLMLPNILMMVSSMEFPPAITKIIPVISRAINMGKPKNMKIKSTRNINKVNNIALTSVIPYLPYLQPAFCWKKDARQR